VIPAAFDYVRAGSAEEAIEALSDPEAKVLAGGHSLLPMMKLRLARPSRLVDIGGLDFRGVADSGGEIAIGALTTYEDFARLDGIPDALRECAASVGDLQVRNAGTVGGGIAHGDPASDFAAGVLALEARLRLRSATGTRECAADEFFISPFTTGLEQQELLTEIVVARPQAGEGSAYVSVEDPASGYALAGAAARVSLESGGLSSCTIALTGAAGWPARLRGVETALLASDGAAGVDVVRQALSDLELDIEGDEAEYRRQLVAVVVSRAVQEARGRAERGASA
jgi:carbon-monoxide dehydrogenase medium subunit